MFLKDFLFPKFCLGCGLIGTYLCPECGKKLEYFDKEICLYCGKKSHLGFTHYGCQQKNGVDNFFTIFRYNGILKKIIKAFKYRRAVDVWNDFILSVRPSKTTNLITWKRESFSETKDSYYLQPIPLHPSKLRDRGFNQAEIISDYFNRFLRLEKINALVRKKDTKPQAQTEGKLKRRKNVGRAFNLYKGIRLAGRSIILVDDLLTTGATIKEAAKALKNQGAKRVFALTLAKG